MKRFGWLIALGVVLVIILAAGLGFAGSYNGDWSRKIPGNWTRSGRRWKHSIRTALTSSPTW